MKKLSFALVAFAFRHACRCGAGSRACREAKGGSRGASPSASGAARERPRLPARSRHSRGTGPSNRRRGAGASAITRPQLTAVTTEGGDDPALETSLIQVMSRLLAAGQCGEAAGLAARGGPKELASRAQQLCK